MPYREVLGEDRSRSSVNLEGKLFGNGAIYLGANILNAGIPFLLLPILTRILTPSDYGKVAMFGIVLSVLGAFTGLSVHGSIGVRYFQLERKVLSEYVGACVGILISSSTITFLIIAIFGARLADVTGVPSDWLLVAVVLSGFQFLCNIRLSLWQVGGQSKKYGAFQVLQSLFNAGFSLILIFFIGLTWQGRVLGQFLAVGIFGFVAVTLLLKDGLLSKSNNWSAHFCDALNFGIPLIPHVISGIALSMAGQFIVTTMFDVSKTGIYVIGAQFGLVVGIIADAFVKSYSPWLCEKLNYESNEVRNLIVGMTYFVFISFFFLALVTSLVVVTIFPFIVGHEFISARFLVIYFIFGNALTGMYYAIAGFFFFTSKTKYISIITAISGLTSIILMWYLGGEIGVEGVALGYFISQLIMLFLAWGMTFFVYPLPWLEFRTAFSELFLHQNRK